MKKIWIALVACAIIGVCFWLAPFEFQKSRAELTAEEVLERYLNLVFSMKSLDDKKELLSYAIGSLKEAIAKAEDSVLEEAYLRHKYKILRFSLIQRRDQTPMETHLTYQLEYQDDINREGQPDQQVYMIENTVSMVRQDKHWFIQEILANKKTTIDFPIPEIMTPSFHSSAEQQSSVESETKIEEKDRKEPENK